MNLARERQKEAERIEENDKTMTKGRSMRREKKKRAKHRSRHTEETKIYKTTRNKK